MNKDKPLTLKAYNRIMSDIVTKVYKPNDIITETALVEKYGHSKTPIREALISLCNDGVLRNIPRYGYEVLGLTTEDVKEMLEFRYFLEGGLITKNGHLITQSQLDYLEKIDGQTPEDASDVWAFWQQNSDFHLQLIKFSGNSYAADALEKCLNRLKRAYAHCYWDEMQNTFTGIGTKNHSDIIDCIREQKLHLIYDLLKEDLNRFVGGDRPLI